MFAVTCFQQRISLFSCTEFVLNDIYSTQFPAKNLKIVSGITEFENENNTIVVALWSCRYSSRCAVECKQPQDMAIIHYGLFFLEIFDFDY